MEWNVSQSVVSLASRKALWDSSTCSQVLVGLLSLSRRVRCENPDSTSLFSAEVGEQCTSAWRRTDQVDMSALGVGSIAITLPQG